MSETKDLSRKLMSVASVDALIESVIPDISDHLEREGEIARGGMASIHTTIDKALHRRVALKLIHSEHQNSMLAVRAFLREAQITGQLDHPNIVPVHELGTDETGHLYFTMKLVEGRTLQAFVDSLRESHDRVNDEGLYIPTAIEHNQLLRLLDVFFKVLDAIAFAHSRGVVHCDLKPENVMVGDYGQVYLMDWGIARVMPQPVGRDPLRKRRYVRDTLPPLENSPNVIMGTPAYMSPEQARGDQARINQGSDVFALGAMLFEFLTGHPPYQGTTAIDVLMQAEDCAAELPEHLPIPRELRRIVRVAMAKDPTQRYQRVEDMQRDLQGFMRGGDNFPRQNFEAGDWIIRENEVGDAAYIIISGRCEVLKVIEGQNQSLRTLGPGDVFGETAILASRPRSASIKALTKVVTVIVTADVLEREVDAMKPWMGAFIRALAQRFAEAAQAPQTPRERKLAADSLASMRRVELDAEASAPRRTGRTHRQLKAVNPNQGVLSDPAQVANQALMVLKSWGKWDRDLGQAMSLKRLCQNLETICGIDQSEILAILSSFKQFWIEPKHDSISLRDERSLAMELERVLKMKG